MRVVGVVVGQARDPSALVVLDDCAVIHAEGLPLHLPYPAVAKWISAVTTAAGNPLIAIDSTGIGRATVDLVRQDGYRVLAVTIGAGKLVRRSGDGVSVPKSALLSLLVAAVEGRRLRVAKGCRFTGELLIELAAFEKRRDSRGRISGSRQRATGIMAISGSRWRWSCSRKGWLGSDSNR